MFFDAFDNAEGMVFRPPSEAKSLILRVTIGCSHNACTFCSMYRDVRFRARPLDEIAAIIGKAARYYPDLRRVFLADGNALVLATDKLLAIMDMLKNAFPKLSRITIYGGPRDILRKTPEELAALRRAGLAIIYLGIESGDDVVLAKVNKGVTAAEMVAAGRKVLDAGIKLSTMVILGLGGRERTEEHALHTAEVVSAINPTMLSALTLMLHKGTPLRQAAEQGEFQPLSPYEFLVELRQMLKHITLSEPCLFRSNHVSNLLPLAGTLPQDKEQLLADIDEVLAHFQDKRTPTFNDEGPF
ncbi:radical SAM protein [Sporolituus thermophilus]|uniref:Fe-S oxidoreductase n=1 Tax=Sporolituus thermophilus DSM 23256 TaxID=1123285 RepID=A0A1G7KIZ6_9FIRM|nr:radical SAM protein [Sporolituus thermophilus]SDF36759.1 Fe-S oxidoreductase [Sporolituus thermophilus DSM 23256]